MMDAGEVDALLELGTIEIAPLAFMRGRTLSDAFDESSTRRRTPRPNR